MARIRTVKPSFWSDPDVVALRREARLLLIGLISMADDEGRFVATTNAIAGYVFPHDELPAATIRRWRDEIAKAGIIELYTIDRFQYGHFPNWKRHQRISKPQSSLIPAALELARSKDGTRP
jgi:hypothetical protein